MKSLPISVRKFVKNVYISKPDAIFICNELQRRGILKTYVLVESKKAIDFNEYLLNFWNWESSPYIREKLRKKHSIHRRHALEMSGTVKKYWFPFFKGKMLGELTRQDIDDFISYLEIIEDKAIKKQAKIDKAIKEKAIKENAAIAAGFQKPKRKNAAAPKRQIVRFPKSAKRKNTIIKAGTIALSYAYNKEMVDRDITKGITWFSNDASKERRILTREQAAAIFKVQWKNHRSYLANMIAMVTGMRVGEIQGLRVQDLGKDCLYVRHSWSSEEGLKTTKTNESRIVEVPFPKLMRELIDLAERTPHIQNMENYIFWNEASADKPIEQYIILRDLRVALIKSGMSKEYAKQYTVHGWRHFFTSYMLERLNNKLLQSQTGHKTLQMIQHYSNHIITGEREKIQQAQLAVFGGLLPN